MGYNNQNNGYNNQNNGYQNNQNNNNQQPKKRTGCTFRSSYTHKTGPKAGQVENSPLIYGYNIRQNGRSSFVAVPNHKNPTTKSPRWLNMVVTISPPGMSAKITTTGFWDTQKKRLHMPDMDMIANPNAPNGGYWGRNYKPKNG